MSVFLVSGGDDLETTRNVLQAEGWIIRTGDEIGEIEKVLLDLESSIVIAHGSPEGSVYIENADGTVEWISPALATKCHSGRIYFYCCHAGKHLVPAMATLEVFGHVDTVPMPTAGSALDCVTRFLAIALDTVKTDAYDRDAWQSKLMDFLDESQAEEGERPIGPDGSFDNFLQIHLLRKSLNFGNPMWQ